MKDRGLDDAELILANSYDKLQYGVRRLGERQPHNIIAFDTETEGLRPYSGQKVKLLQIGTGKVGVVFTPEWIGPGLEFLAKWEGEYVAHNLKFDASFLTSNYGHLFKPDWRRMHDTMIMARLDDSTRSAALKTLSSMYVSQDAEVLERMMNYEFATYKLDFASAVVVEEGPGAAYWQYAALDPILACRLYDVFHHVRTTYAQSYDLEMSTLRCIFNMERKGMRVDLGHSRKMIDEFSQQAQEIRKWVTETYGIANAGSAAQCLALFESLGREITEFTDSGTKSLNKVQLQKFLIEGDGNLPGNDLARAILEMRKIEKQIGPYFQAFGELVDSDGFIRPSVNSMGARTGRMSIQSPALQTLPKGDPAVRDAFIAREGHVMGSIDADQIEMRLAAHFSRDEGLRKAFLEEPDFFNYIASQVYGRTITKGDSERNLIKTFCYAKLYGAGVEKMALSAEVPVSTIEQVRDRFDSNFPGPTRLAKRIERTAQERAKSEGRPYIVTPFGRKLFGDSDREFALTNYILQSHAAELLKQGICDLDAAGLGEYMDLPVHDELIFEAPEEDFDDVSRGFQEVLTNVGKEYFVPLTWGFDKLGDKWGNKARLK